MVNKSQGGVFRTTENKDLIERVRRVKRVKAEAQEEIRVDGRSD